MSISDEKKYREYIERDEAVDEIMEHGEEVDLNMSPEDQREARITVRLKADEVKMVDQLCDQLGVGRSTALKIALRMVSKGLVLSSPNVWSRPFSGMDVADMARAIELGLSGIQKAGTTLTHSEASKQTL